MKSLYFSIKISFYLTNGAENHFNKLNENLI